MDVTIFSLLWYSPCIITMEINHESASCHSVLELWTHIIFFTLIIAMDYIGNMTPLSFLSPFLGNQFAWITVLPKGFKFVLFDISWQFQYYFSIFLLGYLFYHDTLSIFGISIWIKILLWIWPEHHDIGIAKMNVFWGDGWHILKWTCYHCGVGKQMASQCILCRLQIWRDALYSFTPLSYSPSYWSFYIFIRQQISTMQSEKVSGVVGP